ncbi:MAG: recombinase family protein [Rhizobiaceae bacterium]|nr:recombinase family protein [Rhizobiaceae bacterium]
MKYFVYCRKSQEAEDRQVMSLASQAEEIDRIITSDPTIEVVDRYEEAYSAKQPGRPLFDAMLKRIEKGDAQGIIAWHPDRLARNSMDGGRIIFLLDTGAIKNLSFCSYAFENSSQGKFMLTIIFGYSKYYVDSLSENVKRGLRTKVRNGWRPNLAPIGYRNCKETGTVVPDGEHFTAVRRMFDLLLTGSYTVSQIHRTVCDEWGYITPILKTRGGKRIALGTLYRIFNNPFYAGYIRWQGELHPGNHKPVISKTELEQARRILQKPRTPRPQRLDFRYAGVFACGVCGRGVTAERKRKPNGREYVYYHCTRVHTTPHCTQPSIESAVLERQVAAFLDRICLPPAILDWFRDTMAASSDAIAEGRKEVTARLVRQSNDLERQIANLTDLRVREMISDDEFMSKRETLQRSLAETKERASQTEREPVAFEPLLNLQILCSRAKYWFSTADNHTKRSLLKILCSNPVIRDRKALLEAKKPFIEMGSLAQFSHLCGDSDTVRRVSPDADAVCERLLRAFAEREDVVALAAKAHELIAAVEPNALGQGETKRSL